MNKKAQFIAFFVVLLLVVFSTLAYAMYKHKKYEEKLTLNAESSSTFKTYSLVERNKYYLEKAAEFSKQKAIAELEKNAGHLPNQCSLSSLTTGKILWNTCPKLNLEEDFKTLFKTEFKKYIETQYQLYPKTGYESNLNKDEIQKLEASPEIKNNKLIINFKEFSYQFNYQGISKEHNSFSVKYIFNPAISIKEPDFLIYDQLCKALIACNLNPNILDSQIDSCIISLNKINNLKTTKNNDILDLNYGNLDFSVDLKSRIDCKKP